MTPQSRRGGAARVAFATAVATVGLAVAGCGGGKAQTAPRFIYDADGHDATVLTLADVVPSSVKAVHDPANGAIVQFELTASGQKAMIQLTRDLAQRGARLHRFQSYAMELGGRVYRRVVIDYRVMPNGMPSDTGRVSTIMGLRDMAAARRIAALIRR